MNDLLEQALDFIIEYHGCAALYDSSIEDSDCDGECSNCWRNYLTNWDPKNP